MVPGFMDTVLARQWDQTMSEIGGLYAECDAEGLNALFRSFNPQCSEMLLSETGREPFDRETMTRNRDRRERIGMS
jgi:hypothetical protein